MERGKSSKNIFFFGGGGGRRDNMTLKVQILLSRNFVVVAQVPIFVKDDQNLRNNCMTVRCKNRSIRQKSDTIVFSKPGFAYQTLQLL